VHLDALPRKSRDAEPTDDGIEPGTNINPSLLTTRIWGYHTFLFDHVATYGKSFKRTYLSSNELVPTR
jgi:hypothetical protein